ncbi:MAG: PilZ domain-containing protein [Fimbriimonadales bacterium]|nr:PilZ domain-containing protein [Fimbriimonadales bacterium]
MNTLQIRVPNADQTLSGVLIGVDRATMRFVAQFEQGIEYLKINTTAQAVLTIGDAPRQLAVQITGISGDTLTFTPVSAMTPCERRERKRYPVNLQAQLRQSEGLLPVRVVNISVGGLGLHAPQALEKGLLFEIELLLLGVDQALCAQAQVRHCRPLGGGNWYIGAAFVDLSRADALWLRKLFP